MGAEGAGGIIGKEFIVSSKVTQLRGLEGDQEIPDGMVKVPFLGKVDSLIRLGIKADMRP